MTRIVMPNVWKAIEIIAVQAITSELPVGVTFPDAKLDALILAAREVFYDDEPIDLHL